MASLVWRAVSIILGLEMVILVGLCAPLPWGVRKNISRWIYELNAQAHLNAALRYILFGLILAFLESLHALRKEYQKDDEVSDKTSSDSNDASLNLVELNEHRWLMTRAERNVYLAGFAIAAMLAITRLVHLASIEVQLRNKIKQFNGNVPIAENGESLEALRKED